ncbi:MAG: PP2C family protein-serine/threonine phosphatase [Parahaliea sp.]
MTFNAKVLIIDDQPERAQDVRALVESACFEVDVVSDFTHSHYSLADGSDLDVILCELELNGVSWGEARRSLREMNVQVPVIMLSDEADAGRIMKALRLGASDFFVRPVEDTEALIKSIQRCVRQRELRRELDASRKRLEATNLELRGTVKMLEQDQQAGRQVQFSMLPSTPLVSGCYSFSHCMVPSLFLSGDFTDYFTVGEHQIVFFMADVSGHGSSSAFATVLLKNLFARKRSAYSRRGDDTVLSPVAMLQRANQELLRLDVGKFATMVVGLLDIKSNRLRYSIAGHLPQPVLISQGKAGYLSGSGPAVGLMDEADYQVYEIELPATFSLVLFSDGILEIMPCEDLIEKEACLLEFCRADVDSPEALLDHMGMKNFEELPDDIAVLYIRRQG